MKFRNIILAALLLVPLALSAQAPPANFYALFSAGSPGAGLAVVCGGDLSGIRGTYLCDIDQSGNTITVNFQDANSNADSFVFTLDDGVVTSGVIDALGDTLTLTVDTAGVESVVDIAIPAILRTDDQTATEVTTDTSNFGGNLSSLDDTVQDALDTIDNFTLGGGGGGGSTTFVALTDTPSVITADECVQGNSSGNALEFGSCGTGSGPR